MRMWRINGIWTLVCADGCIAARGTWDDVRAVMKSWN